MKRMLVVEDTKEIADLERDYLEMEGVEVEWAADGRTGRDKALQETYSLILLDVMLPYIDGFEICRMVRKSKETPIIMVTARQADIDKIRGLGLGANDYVVKPFSPGELVARVKGNIARYERVMSVREEQKPVTIESDGLKIELDTRRASVNGEEIPLPPKEFDLLAYMAAHPGKVLTKTQLFEQVWGVDAMSDTATVTVHVNRIREKLALVSPVSYIETVWGTGYRFKD